MKNKRDTVTIQSIVGIDYALRATHYRAVVALRVCANCE